MELSIGPRGARIGGLPRAESIKKDADLGLDKARERNLEAFSKVVDTYQNRVFGFVRRMVANSDEAADVTQEVFIRAFQSFDRFDHRSSVRTWLFRIAHNLCIDRSRKAKRSVAEVGLVDTEHGEELEVFDDRWQPDQMAMDGELMEVVEASILSMSEKLRSVLLLHDREDMAYDEIADLLGLPVGTVKSRLFLARTHLQNSVRVYLDRENLS